MSRKMLINATHPEEHRVAIVEDGYLTELDIEITAKEQTKGNVYKASVVRVESGLQAAFVDYGGERLGFLQISEIHPSLYPKSDDDRRSRPRISDILRPGQEILVQVLKEERGTKGAALTSYLSLAGRYMVLMPESPTKGVSRKIEEEAERKKLKKAMAELNLPEDMGYIVRTAGIGKSHEELRRDFDNLVQIYRGIQERSKQLKAPSLIFRESNLIIRCIRDYFTEDTEEVLIDDPAMYEAARDFFRMLMPDKQRLVKLHQERRPIFSRYQIEEQIETINHNKVNLPSGGSIVIDTTEALVAVDVNSGKMASEQGIESTAYKTNIEAADEVARQLRLRDLAGLIVIDFIDMRDRKHIRAVEKILRDALKKDKARVTVGRISQFGLLEMSRQRLKPNLAAASFVVCPQCQGHGQIKSIETQGLAFLRRIQAAAAKGQIQRIEGRLPLDVASYLQNIKREELYEMERRYDMKIVLDGRSDLLSHESDFDVVRREKEEDAADTEIPPIELAPSAEAVQAELAAVAGAEQTTRDQSAATDSQNGEGNRKKRRRRRRRKKNGGAEEQRQSTPEVAATPEQATSKEEPSKAAESPEKLVEPVKPNAPSAPPMQDGPPAKATEPIRPTEPETHPEEPTEKTGKGAASEQAATEAADTEEARAQKPKPKPRTRRPRKTAAKEKMAPSMDVKEPAKEDATESKQTEENAAPATPAVPPAEKTPAKPRARRPRKSTSPKEKPAAETSEKGPAEDGKTSDQASEAKGPEPGTAAENASDKAADKAPSPAPEPEAEPARPKKAPARRRGRPKKTEALAEKPENIPGEQASTPPPQAEISAAPESAPAEKKPSPRRRTTRKSSPSGKEAEKTKNSAPSTGGESPDQKTEKEGERKPAAARTRKAAAGKTEKKEPDAEKKPEPENEAPAKRTRRAPRRRTTEEKTPEE